MNKLSDELGRIIAEEFQAVFDREVQDADFMPQGDFVSCQERANAMLGHATQRAAKVLAIAIAAHRQEKHSEDRSIEMESLTASVSDEDVSVGVRSWWNW